MPTPGHGVSAGHDHDHWAPNQTPGNHTPNHTHHRMISPQRPRGPYDEPANQQQHQQQQQPQQQAQPPQGGDMEGELRALQTRIKQLQHQDYTPSPGYALSPAHYHPRSGGALQLQGHLSPDKKRKRRPGLRAGMIAASVVIVAASRVLVPEQGTLLYALSRLAKYGLASERVAAQLEREQIMTCDSLLRCSDDDLRHAGLRIGEVNLLRDKRNELLLETYDPQQATLTAPHMGEAGHPSEAASVSQEPLMKMLEDERQERRTEVERMHSQMASQAQELQEAIRRIESARPSEAATAAHDDEVRRLRSALDEKSSEAARATSRVKALEGELAQNADALEQLRTSSTSQASFHQNQASALQSQVQDLQSQVADAARTAATLAQMEENNRALRATLQAQTEQLDAAHADIDGKDKVIAELKAENRELKRLLDDARSIVVPRMSAQSQQSAENIEASLRGRPDSVADDIAAEVARLSNSQRSGQSVPKAPESSFVPSLRSGAGRSSYGGGVPVAPSARSVGSAQPSHVDPQNPASLISHGIIEDASQASRGSMQPYARDELTDERLEREGVGEGESGAEVPGLTTQELLADALAFVEGAVGRPETPLYGPQKADERQSQLSGRASQPQSYAEVQLTPRQAHEAAGMSDMHSGLHSQSQAPLSAVSRNSQTLEGVPDEMRSYRSQTSVNDGGLRSQGVSRVSQGGVAAEGMSHSQRSQPQADRSVPSHVDSQGQRASQRMSASQGFVPLSSQGQSVHEPSGQDSRFVSVRDSHGSQLAQSQGLASVPAGDQSQGMVSVRDSRGSQLGQSQGLASVPDQSQAHVSAYESQPAVHDQSQGLGSVQSRHSQRLDQSQGLASVHDAQQSQAHVSAYGSQPAASVHDQSQGLVQSRGLASAHSQRLDQSQGLGSVPDQSQAHVSAYESQPAVHDQSQGLGSVQSRHSQRLDQSQGLASVPDQSQGMVSVRDSRGSQHGQSQGLASVPDQSQAQVSGYGSQPAASVHDQSQGLGQSRGLASVHSQRLDQSQGLASVPDQSQSHVSAYESQPAVHDQSQGLGSVQSRHSQRLDQSQGLASVPDQSQAHVSAYESQPAVHDQSQGLGSVQSRHSQRLDQSQGLASVHDQSQAHVSGYGSQPAASVHDQSQGLGQSRGLASAHSQRLDQSQGLASAPGQSQTHVSAYGSQPAASVHDQSQTQLADPSQQGASVHDQSQGLASAYEPVQEQSQQFVSVRESHTSQPGQSQSGVYDQSQGLGSVQSRHSQRLDQSQGLASVHDAQQSQAHVSAHGSQPAASVHDQSQGLEQSRGLASVHSQRLDQSQGLGSVPDQSQAHMADPSQPSASVHDQSQGLASAYESQPAVHDQSQGLGSVQSRHSQRLDQSQGLASVPDQSQAHVSGYGSQPAASVHDQSQGLGQSRGLASAHSQRLDQSQGLASVPAGDQSQGMVSVRDSRGSQLGQSQGLASVPDQSQAHVSAYESQPAVHDQSQGLGSVQSRHSQRLDQSQGLASVHDAQQSQAHVSAYGSQPAASVHDQSQGLEQSRGLASAHSQRLDQSQGLGSVHESHAHTAEPSHPGASVHDQSQAHVSAYESQPAAHDQSQGLGSVQSRHSQRLDQSQGLASIHDQSQAHVSGYGSQPAASVHDQSQGLGQSRGLASAHSQRLGQSQGLGSVHESQAYTAEPGQPAASVHSQPSQPHARTSAYGSQPATPSAQPFAEPSDPREPSVHLSHAQDVLSRQSPPDEARPASAAASLASQPVQDSGLPRPPSQLSHRDRISRPASEARSHVSQVSRQSARLPQDAADEPQSFGSAARIQDPAPQAAESVASFQHRSVSEMYQHKSVSEVGDAAPEVVPDPSVEDSFTEHSSAYGELGRHRDPVASPVEPHDSTVPVHTQPSFGGGSQMSAARSSAVPSEPPVAERSVGFGSEPARSLAASDAIRSHTGSERLPVSEKVPSRANSDIMWDEPAVVWAAWDGHAWRKVSSDVLEETTNEASTESFAIPEGVAQVAGVEPFEPCTAAAGFAFGLKVFKSPSGATLVRFRDALNGDANLSPQPYPGLWLPSPDVLLDVFNNDPSQSFPTPGMLEHTLMMGGQLSLGGRWKCLPLRDVEIARFTSKCRKLVKSGETQAGLYGEALDLLEKADVEGVPPHLLQASLRASLGGVDEPTPQMLVDALTLTQLSWHGRTLVIALQNEPYVVTDVTAGNTHVVWHLKADL